jgi:hypothetical protein
MFKLFREQEFSTNVGEDEMIAEGTIEAQCFAPSNIEFIVGAWFTRRKIPQVMKKVVCKYNILLICRVEDMVDMQAGLA